MKYLIPVLAALLAGCSSTPQSNYYLLHSTATNASSPCDCSIGIGPVTVAEYLNRPQITTSAEPGRLNIDQFHRWGEPLRHNIERTVLENLATLTGSSQLRIHPWRQGQRPGYRVAINILSMDRAAGNATVKVQWQVDAEAGQSSGTQLQTFSSPVADDSYAALAQGFSQALLQLSEKIAEQLDSLSP
ncbi:MAG: PqiC family protein [Porticoccaceae bacterium]|nr:PqiC family protein [Porticoccaceae bacterium]